MKIDKLNLSIIRHLHDGRKSFKKIAEELSITENTVRSRVNKMAEEEVLSITGLVDADKLPDHQTVLVGIKLNTANLVAKAKEFVNLKGVVSVRVVTGRYDLFLVVLLKKGFGLLEFLSKELDKVDSVQSVETFVVYKGWGHKVPYVL